MYLTHTHTHAQTHFITKNFYLVIKTVYVKFTYCFLSFINLLVNVFKKKTDNLMTFVLMINNVVINIALSTYGDFQWSSLT